jgi:iron(II)-dependent oxidoreductase
MSTTEAVAAPAGPLAELLAEARARTCCWWAALRGEMLRQHSSLMSPLVWDMGHIAHFEELWLVRNLEGPVEFVEMRGCSTPSSTPAPPAAAPAPHPLADAGDHGDGARPGAERLDAAPGPWPRGRPLRRDGYVYRMVAQHEYQHNETMLQALQLLEDRPYRAPAP